MLEERDGKGPGGRIIKEQKKNALRNPQSVIFMEAVPGVEHGDKGLAGPTP